VVLVAREVAQIVHADRDAPTRHGGSEDRLAHERLEESGEDRDDVDSHATPLPFRFRSNGIGIEQTRRRVDDDAPRCEIHLAQERSRRGDQVLATRLGVVDDDEHVRRTSLPDPLHDTQVSSLAVLDPAPDELVLVVLALGQRFEMSGRSQHEPPSQRVGRFTAVDAIEREIDALKKKQRAIGAKIKASEAPIREMAEERRGLVLLLRGKTGVPS